MQTLSALENPMGLSVIPLKLHSAHTFVTYKCILYTTELTFLWEWHYSNGTFFLFLYEFCILCDFTSLPPSPAIYGANALDQWDDQ